MNKKLTWKSTVQLFKTSFKGFADHKITKLSGSLAYSTVFSMPPLLIVIIAFCGLFFGQEAVQGKIYGQLEQFMGHDTALQLQEVIRRASLSGKSHKAAIIGIIALLIGATAVFSEIQSSINTIWGLTAKPRKGLVKILRNRFLSFSVIISLGFLLLVSLSISSLIDEFSDRLRAAYPHITIVVFYIINQLFTLIVITTIFAVIFKVLPDGKIQWKDILAGALVTAILFMLGKFAISFYISKSSAGSTYGPAAALVVLLLWTYYSSFILYFGAEFTRAWVMHTGAVIQPDDYAVIAPK